MLARLLAASTAFFVAAPAAIAPRSWLDGPVSNWNQPRMAIPRAPKPEQEAAGTRPPVTAEERALEHLGWHPMGPAIHHGRLALVRASVEGGDLHFMQHYNWFAFSDGRFIGTLAPGPMTSSTDGAIGEPYEVTNTGFKAAYARYTPTDPFCCPSRVSELSFQVKGGPAHSVGS